MKIHIETIPHDKQRYPTCGDWWFDPDGTLQIRVSQMSNWRREALVATHELHEALICKHNKVREEDVSKFDIAFEKRRAPGNEDEPGDEPAAPYKREHSFASGVERLLSVELNVDWKPYGDEIAGL